MKRYRIEPGSKVDLLEWDANDRDGYQDGKDAARLELKRISKRLRELQTLLYAEHKHKLLILLQGMDTSGKDGTISHVFKSTNPQGVAVANFKSPTPAELDHDYLWRAHQRVPGKGEIAIFNRSHYEDVLIVRVHHLVPDKVWRRRYDQINNFEQMLAEEGMTICKFYLNIDQAEQKKRLQARLDDPHKEWKFDPQDLSERKLWPEYIKAYEQAISRTSTDWAPWYIVPSNRKWYRNLVVAATILETLEGLGMSYPDPPKGLDGLKVK